jgi:HlyD family secretion protein
MKKTSIITGIVVGLTIIALVLFNKMTLKKNTQNFFAEVQKGNFEISISAAGELIPEKSVDIKGPEISQTNNQQGGGGGGGRGQGGEMRVTDIKIQDIVPEGTIVNQGDYVAQLDRTSYDNTLKDAYQTLTKYQTNVEMKTLDTAVVLTNLRDEIKNQRYVVEEAVITLAQSKYEPPSTIRQAEISLDKAKRTLEQKEKGYSLRVAQSLSEINSQKQLLAGETRLVTNLQEFLTKFTVSAPASGMVIYKKDRMGSKRKSGSSISPFDMVIATLPDLSSMISKTYVNEIEVSKVKIGQEVNIVVDAFPKESYLGHVMSVANIGEQLPNSDAKMFETQIKMEGSNSKLRPSMTTGNKLIIKSIDNAIYIPTECVQTGADGIPYVYQKNKTRQIVILGEANEKNVIVEQGLEPGTNIYLNPPEKAESFKLVGQDLIPIIREREKVKIAENSRHF